MNRILIIVYEAFLWMIAVLSIPKMLYQFFIYKKYRKSILARLGFKCPPIKKGKGPLIWIHAVSMGETKAIVSLVHELKKQLAGCQLLISSTTETGHAEAKRSLPFADYHIYLPFDFYLIMQRTISKIAPDLVILCESDIWYNFLRLVKGRGVPLILVNGKMSERSSQRFSKILFFSKPLLNLFDVLCLQNEMYRQRFITAGALAEKLIVTGNLKLDEYYPSLSPEEVQQWRYRLGISCDDFVLTIGSSHDPEEQLFLHILKQIWKKIPNLKVILVPRHPERFKEVARLLEKELVNAINFTNIHQRTGHEQVLLIDAMGMLRMCYQLSDVALVGGSYTNRVGGHNILEPCWYSKPVLFGPFMHSQVELAQLVKQYGAGAQVDDKELGPTLEYWFQNLSERTQVGQRGSILIKDLRGSTKRTLDACALLLFEVQKQFNI